MKQFISGLGNIAPASWARFGVCATLAVASVALIAGASARSRSHSDPEKKVEEATPPTGPLFFVISIGKQHVSVYGNDGLYARAPVSTGRAGHSTPMGLFNILEKDRYHHSNIYSGAPMPFMQRITWSGVAMHEGVLPGYPASHGCIRMPHEFAKRMFGLTQGTEHVIISRQDIIPTAFAHPRLPAPKFMPLPSADNIASGSLQMLQNAVAMTAAGGTAKLDVAVKADGTAGEKDAAQEQKLLNPLDFAREMKARASKQADEAAAAVTPARGILIVKNKEVAAASIVVRKAEIALSNAKDKLEDAERKVGKASGDEAVNAATLAKSAAEAKVKDAQEALDAAKQAKSEKEQDAAAASRTFKDADNARKAAADAAKSWNRRLAPISIFVSRKTQRLYVRQGYIKVFDVPVTIKDPEKPLGTHLYLAMQPAKAAPDTTPTLRWLVLSLPEAASGDSDEPRSRRRHRHDDEDNAPRAASTTSASNALDRIEVPAAVSDKISEMLWAGGSLVVSDSGLSGETGDHTDFVVLTR